MKGIWTGVLIIFSALMMTGFMVNGQMLVEIQQIAKEQDAIISMLEQKQEPKIQLTIFDYIASRNKTMTIKQIAEFVAYVYQLGEEEQVDPYLIFAICDIESNFYLDAIGAAGEAGPMQIMKSTWNIYADRYTFRDSDFGNWFCNMKIATVYLRDLFNCYHGNIQMVIGHYNGGIGGYQKPQCQYHLKKFQVASRGMMRYREANHAGG